MGRAPENASSSYARAAHGNGPARVAGKTRHDAPAVAARATGAESVPYIWRWCVVAAALAVVGVVVVVVADVSPPTPLHAPRATLILSDRYGVFLNPNSHAADQTAAPAHHL